MQLRTVGQLLVLHTHKELSDLGSNVEWQRDKVVDEVRDCGVMGTYSLVIEAP